MVAKNKWQAWSADKIAQLALDRKGGRSIKYLMEKYGRSYGAISMKLWEFKSYRNKGTTFNGENLNLFREALEYFNEVTTGNHTTPDVQTLTNHPVDHYTGLEDAFNNFSKAIELFVEIEVEKRTEDTKKRYESIIAKKDKDYKDLVEQARESNWVGALRRKFGDVPKTF